jgi:hypothetical protein
MKLFPIIPIVLFICYFSSAASPHPSSSIPISICACQAAQGSTNKVEPGNTSSPGSNEEMKNDSHERIDQPADRDSDKTQNRNFFKKLHHRYRTKLV